jgi:hypothetical protein
LPGFTPNVLSTSVVELTIGTGGELVIEQIFESFRKAAESSLQTQQDIFKQFSQQWPAGQLQAAGTTAGATEGLQKHLRLTMATALERDRELLDAAFSSGSELIEQTFQLYGARSPEDCRRVLEGAWRKLIERTKEQSDSQVRMLQTVSTTWLDVPAKEGEEAAKSEP